MNTDISETKGGQSTADPRRVRTWWVGLKDRLALRRARACSAPSPPRCPPRHGHRTTVFFEWP